MEDYIILFPDTFLWFNSQNGILYKCDSGDMFEFECDDTIYKYCTQFVDLSNLYSLPISMYDRNNEIFLRWLNDIVSHKMGVIEYKRQKKTISIPPVLNLRQEIEDANNTENVYSDTINTASCIHEISILLGDNIKFHGHENYYKQIPYPIYSKKQLDFNSLHFFFERSCMNYVRQINVFSLNILDYVELNKLMELLQSYEWDINYYMPGDSLSSLKCFVKKITNKKSHIKLYYINEWDFVRINEWANNNLDSYSWVFILENKEELSKCEMLSQDYTLKNIELYPVYTVDNLSFFQENVFTTLDDIYSSKITKQKIFCNQVINSNLWGKLYILPNNTIHTSLNHEVIGTIGDDIFEIISNELKNPKSPWKSVRKKVTPCKNCLYSNLCPPPSTYEYFMNKFNLCFINKCQLI